MIFKGISKTFSLVNEDQYNTIGAFWDEMEQLYGLENLKGLGYRWNRNTIEYAIGLKVGEIKGSDFCMRLPDVGWMCAIGKTDRLKELYDEIYRGGPLTYEIETFYADGHCEILYYREGN